MYPGWLVLGGGDVTVGAPYIEIVNNARAYAYARNMGICWLRECEDCPTTELSIPGGDYHSPALDPAPWYRESNPDTWGFLGVVGLDVHGDVTSTRRVTVESAVSFGGVLGPPYFGPRTLVIRCLAIAVDECSLTAGLEWLNFFASMPQQPCLGDDLSFFDCCPCLCPDEPEPHCWPTDYDGLMWPGPACANGLWPYTYDDLITGPYMPAGDDDYVPSAGVLLNDPFNDLSAWSSIIGSPTIVPGGRRGTAVQIDQADQAWFRLPPANEDDVMTVGCAFKTTDPTFNRTNAMIGFRGGAGANNHAALRVNTVGGLQVQVASVIVAASAPGLIQPNTWNYVEMQVKLGDAPDGAVIVRLNGEEVINATGVDTRGGGTVLRFDTVALHGGGFGPVDTIDDLYVKTGDDHTFEGDHLIPNGSPWCVWPRTYYGLPLGPPPCCVAHCVQPYIRQYYNAMVTAGPVVLQHPAMHSQGAMAEFELTIVAADPAKHMLVDPFISLPVPVDGSVVLSAPDTVPTPADPFDIPGQTSIRAMANVLTRAAPARPYDLPLEWRRSETVLETGQRGQIGDVAAPVIEVSAYRDQAEFVRVGLWSGDSRVAGWLLPFIPAYSTVTIDASRRIVFTDRNGEPRRLSGFVKDWDGGPMTFPELAHGTYRVTVDQEADRAVRLLLRASSVAVA